MAKPTRTSIVQRQEQAKVLRRGIRAAQLRVALDKQRGRTTPPAVVRIANRKFPEVIIVEKGQRTMSRPEQMSTS